MTTRTREKRRRRKALARWRRTEPRRRFLRLYNELMAEAWQGLPRYGPLDANGGDS